MFGMFDSPNISKFRDYFSQKDWYHPIEGKSVELSELNEIEKYNANLLKNAADSK